MMASAFMETEESAVGSENARLAGLESQILNSQEIIVRLNRELDSALHRIATLENVCSETQNDLHEKRNRINRLTNEIDEREELNEHLKQELYEKDEKLNTLDDIVTQLKQHIKQEKKDKEERKIHENISCQQCLLLFNEFGKSSESISINDLHSQIIFDRQLSELIVGRLGDNNGSSNESPQVIFEQYHKNERVKFHDLLQKSLITENISDLIDSDDILFELLTHLNSLVRLKETLSSDSKELQNIRSLLQLTDINNDDLIKDLVNKRECIEYLRRKINNSHDFTDYELIKHVLHHYFDFQQQQDELKEYLHLNNDDNNELSYSRLLMDRCSEAVHVGTELHQRIQTLEQLNNQLDEHIKEKAERHKQIDEIVATFYNKSIDQDTNEVTQLNRIRSILQADADFRHELSAETPVTSNEDILRYIREYKSIYENYQPVTNENLNQDQQLRINELTRQVDELKEEMNQRKAQLTKITSLLELDTDNEKIIFDLIYSSLKSTTDFSHALSNQLSVKNDSISMLQRIHDYQSIINQIYSHENHWTDETSNELINKLKLMKNAENTIENLEQQLNESIQNEKQSQNDIKEIIEQFLPNIDKNEESNTKQIQHLLTSLVDFRQNLFDTTQLNRDEDILNLFQNYQEDHSNLQELLNQPIQEKQDVESQTTYDDDDDDDFYNQIKKLLGIEVVHRSEDIINKIKELLQSPSKAQFDDLFSNDQKLRDLLNINDENLVESVLQLNGNLLQLQEQQERLIQNLSLEKRMEDLCAIVDRFSIEYSQLVSTDINGMNLIDILKHIRLVLVENNRLKFLIDQLDLDSSSNNLDYASKLQSYSAKVDNLCELIGDDNVNIDLAFVVYQKKIAHDQQIIKKMSNFKQQLLTRLSIDNEDKILDRLSEIERMDSDLKEKLKSHDCTNSTVTSLNVTISEQRSKILEHEETLEKLRTQRERMLNKMKEMKTNNEILVNQLKQTNETIDDFHRKEIDYKNQIEKIEQQLRSANNQIQVTSDECQTQQELQETMKLEIESIKNEMDTQRKLYESRCRQIVHEKNHLDKNQKETLEQKQIVENENKRLQIILQSIKDTLENVDDIDSIVDTILKLRQDHLRLTKELNLRNEDFHEENEKLLSNIQQQQIAINEYINMKDVLEKRLFDNDQQIMHFNKELQEKNNQYQRLQDDYQSYKEEYSTKIIDSQVAIIDVEPSPPSPTHHASIQQVAESNHWMAIDVKDDEIPLTTANKYSTIDTPTALFNLFGEMKSKLGITLTHRPRSSSAFFYYLCAVHFLTIYLLFIRRC
ncbi:unnamed protein product [Rotaria socialis]|uniref:Uncharacterized protein n=1 Tax=Rotaria socialis TaxID=392032 RepID=A0A818G7B5_9BILA|nr:unnamed protein product [Rotaria socialis]